MVQSSIIDFVFVFALGILSTAFLLIAMQNRIFSCARWLGLAFALGALAASLQIYVIETGVWRLGQVLYGFFAVSASVAAILGLLTYYKVNQNWRLFAGFLTLVLLGNWYVQTLPSNIVLERAVVHLPNVFVHLFAAYVVAKFGRRKSLEWILSSSAVVTAAFFLANPVYIGFLSNAAPENMAELLTLFNGTWGAFGIVFSLSNGILVILMFVRDMVGRSRIDRMSGLLNRRTFEDEMDLYLDRIKPGNSDFCLIVADLDHFKSVNDTFGHAQGDAVIIRFAEILRHCAVGDVIAGRLGGEEFGVFLPQCQLASARLFAEAVCGAFRLESFDAGDRPFKLTASFGVAQFDKEESVAAFFARADAALYRAKLAGRDRVYAAQFETPVVKQRLENKFQNLATA